MPNITLSLDEDLLNSGRNYARAHNTSLNSLIRTLLERTVQSKAQTKLEECFQLMDRSGGSSGGQRWKREDLYDV